MVARTDRLADTDLHIKQLAYEMDARLGSGFVLATASGSYTVTNGLIQVPFPLSSVSGAIVLGNASKTYGDPQYANPVPPSSVGLLLPMTQYQIFIDALLSGGVVRCGVRTTTSQGTTSGGTPTNVGWGSRPVTGAVMAYGIAWGRA